MYLISNYETGQYGHEPFDFIILRYEEQDILQIGKTIAELETSKIYLQANKHITGIINTDSAVMNLTIMPEFPCFNNPCTNANCTRTIDQHRFECNCITGHGRSNGTRYKCEGKLIITIVLLQLKLRRNIDYNNSIFLCSFVFTFNLFHPDIDECVTQTHDCHKNAGCFNTIGSFSCKCNIGYSGDGSKCTGMGPQMTYLYLKYYLFEDIDECGTDTYKCDNAICKNTDGSYTCKCDYGYESNGSNGCTGNTNYCLKFENEFLEIISFVF